jgi:phage/plasmid-associated DNA primase
VGLTPPESLENAKTMHRGRVDPIYRFLHECCLQDPTHSIEATLLFDEYREWADEREVGSLSQKAFGTRIRQLGTISDRGRDGRTIYRGLRLLKDLKGSPLSSQPNRIEEIAEDPSEGSAAAMEVSGAPR